MTAVAQTNIDRRQCTRVVPMRVLCLGLPRTGTSSLRIALNKLGYSDTYHMDSVMMENPRDCEMWLDALRAKFEGKGKFNRDHWDQLLGHCQAVVDNPCAAFAPELLKAYPEAKVILNTRSVDNWYRSMLNTIRKFVCEMRCGNLDDLDSTKLRLLEMQVLLWSNTMGCDIENNGKEAFNKHHEMIRQLVPKENLLAYTVDQGWPDLCQFLGEPIPNEPFPRIDDTKKAQEQTQECYGKYVQNEKPRAVVGKLFH